MPAVRGGTTITRTGLWVEPVSPSCLNRASARRSRASYAELPLTGSVTKMVGILTATVGSRWHPGRAVARGCGRRGSSPPPGPGRCRRGRRSTASASAAAAREVPDAAADDADMLDEDGPPRLERPIATPPTAQATAAVASTGRHSRWFRARLRRGSAATWAITSVCRSGGAAACPSSRRRRSNVGFVVVVHDALSGSSCWASWARARCRRDLTVPGRQVEHLGGLLHGHADNVARGDDGAEVEIEIRRAPPSGRCSPGRRCWSPPPAPRRRAGACACGVRSRRRPCARRCGRSRWRSARRPGSDRAPARPRSAPPGRSRARRLRRR